MIRPRANCLRELAPSTARPSSKPSRTPPPLGCPGGSSAPRIAASRSGSEGMAASLADASSYRQAPLTGNSGCVVESAAPLRGQATTGIRRKMRGKIGLNSPRLFQTGCRRRDRCVDGRRAATTIATVAEIVSPVFEHSHSPWHELPPAAHTQSPGDAHIRRGSGGQRIAHTLGHGRRSIPTTPSCSGPPAWLPECSAILERPTRSSCR